VTRGTDRVAFLMYAIGCAASEDSAMTHLRELEPTTKPEDRRSKTLDQILAATTNPHLIALVIFFLIGCLIAAILIQRFPDLGQTAEPFNLLMGP
jgi:hypothetical protein